MFSVPNQQYDALSATQENDEEAHLVRVTGGASYKTGFATQWTLLINMKPFIRFVLGEEGYAYEPLYVTRRSSSVELLHDF